MNSLEFIERDITKSHGNLKAIGIFSLLFAGLSGLIGLGIRGDFRDAFTWSNILPPLLISFGLGVFPWVYISQKHSIQTKRWLLFILFLGIIAISFAQPETAVSLKKFENSHRFWP